MQAPLLALAALPTALLLSADAPSGPPSPLAGANLSTHIYGPKVDADYFAGKVVLVEYWGRN